MGKTLFLIRHAKSSWDDPSINDFDRPLNERGKKDAPEMAKKLMEKTNEIDVLVSSPAKRAKQTCKYFARHFDIKKKKIVFDARLYEPALENFEIVVKELKNKWASAALFSHNPGITYFANSLTQVKLDDMPTCGVFAITSDAKDWKDFSTSKKEYWFFDYPKIE